MHNRLALATVLAMLALSVFVDGLLPLEMPDSARQLVFGTATGAVEAHWKSGNEHASSADDVRMSLWVAGGKARTDPSVDMEDGTVGSATAGYGTWGGGGFAEAVSSRPIITPSQEPGSAPINDGSPGTTGEGAAAALSPLPYPPRQGTERSKEASDGMVESGHGDTDMGISTPGRAGRREGAGLAVRGVATWLHPSLAGNVMADNLTEYWPTQSGLAAAVSWPLGTVLSVRGPSGRSLQLEIRDTGLLERDHLDVSEADFQVLSGRGLEPGVIPVQVRVLE